MMYLFLQLFMALQASKTQTGTFSPFRWADNSVRASYEKMPAFKAAQFTSKVEIKPGFDRIAKNNNEGFVHNELQVKKALKNVKNKSNYGVYRDKGVNFDNEFNADHAIAFKDRRITHSPFANGKLDDGVNKHYLTRDRTESAIPGIDRIIIVPGTQPLLYLGIDRSNIVKVFSSTVISPLKNLGCRCNIAPSSDEAHAYFCSFNDLMICSSGEGNQCGVCVAGAADFLNRNWYIRHYGNDVCFERGGLCLTMVKSDIKFDQTETYDCEMQKCIPGERSQLFRVDFIEKYA